MTYICFAEINFKILSHFNLLSSLHFKEVGKTGNSFLIYQMIKLKQKRVGFLKVESLLSTELIIGQLGLLTRAKYFLLPLPINTIICISLSPFELRVKCQFSFFRRKLKIEWDRLYFGSSNIAMAFDHCWGYLQAKQKDAHICLRALPTPWT